MAILLTFNLTSVAGKQAFVTEGLLKRRVVALQSTGQAKHDRAGLAGDAAAGGVDVDVEFAFHTSRFEGREALGLVLGLGEEVADFLALDEELAFARLDTDASDSGLTSAGTPDETTCVRLGGLG